MVHVQHLMHSRSLQPYYYRDLPRPTPPDFPRPNLPYTALPRPIAKAYTRNTTERPTDQPTLPPITDRPSLLKSTTEW